MKRLQAEAVDYDAKARFIKAVLEGTIELRRATDEMIVALMKKHNLPPTKDADDIESYEYLLRLRMDRVKASAVADAEEAVRRARAAIAELENTTAGVMWLRDLAEFDAAWTKMRSDREYALQNGGTAGPKKNKKSLIKFVAA
jgi:hypothetical protein